MRLLKALLILSVCIAAIYAELETEVETEKETKTETETEAETETKTETETEKETEEETEDDTELKIEDGVLVLTEYHFETVIKENEYVLVEFYAPWCVHCLNLAPEYAKAAKQLEEKGSKIKLAKVDATEEIKLKQDFNVSGFPTLKFFRNGTPIEYTGGRTADTIIGWLTKKTGPVAIEIENVDGAEEFINSHPIVIIGFFKDRESDEAKTFLNVADSVIDYPFGITSNEDVYAKYEAVDGSIILFKNDDDGKSVFERKSPEEAITKFIAEQSKPLIFDFTRLNNGKIFGGDIKSHLLILISKKAGHIEEYVDPLKNVAKLFREKVQFVTMNADEADTDPVFDFFSLKKENVPTIRLINFGDEYVAKFKPKDAELSPDNIKTFVQDFINYKLQRYLLSQELPEDWDKTPVKTFVQTNFDEVVFNKDKDVLVEFYAPWCNDCKNFAPTYDELGEKYKDSETIIIAKIDGTANELDDNRITYFPTIKLYKKDDNSVVEFTGNKTLEALTYFLESGGKLPEVELEVDEQAVNTDEEEGEVADEDPSPKDEL